MSYRVHALRAEPFAHLFSLTDAELASLGAARVTVDAKPGYPCRVSLVDAEVGETVLLVNFEHQSEPTPYRSCHAIYVRERAAQAVLAVDTLPSVLTSRLVSVRAFDARHHMVDADVLDGTRLAERIPSLLTNQAIAYLHLHNAKQGCFVARVTRA